MSKKKKKKKFYLILLESMERFLSVLIAINCCSTLEEIIRGTIKLKVLAVLRLSLFFSKFLIFKLDWKSYKNRKYINNYHLMINYT